MSGVRRAEHGCAFSITIPGEEFFETHDGQDVVHRASQNYLCAGLQTCRGVDVKSDRYRHKRSIEHAHVAQNGLVITLAHESVKGRECSCCHQLQVTDRPCRYLD